MVEESIVVLEASCRGRGPEVGASAMVLCRPAKDNEKKKECVTSVVVKISSTSTEA